MEDGRVSISAGLQGIILAPLSLVVAGASLVLLAFTPVVLAGPDVFFGMAGCVGGLVALIGVALSIFAIVRGSAAAHATPRRSLAIGLGVCGVCLCVLAALANFALARWLSSYVAYTPLWS